MHPKLSLCILLFFSLLSSCRAQQKNQSPESTPNATLPLLPFFAAPSSSGQHPMVAAKIGVSTEHPLSGVGNSRDIATSCRLTRDEVAKMHQKGVYYAAVKGKYYQGQEGAYCGKQFKLTIGGACFYNHNKNCLEADGHGSFDEIAKAPGNQPYNGNKTVTVFIADICGSCIDDALHIDITGDAFLPSGPLHGVKAYFKQNRLANKSGKTTEENNLYIEKIEQVSDCVDFVSLIMPTGPVWGIPRGPCAKMPTNPSKFIMPFMIP